VITLPPILDFLAKHVPSKQMAIRLREIATFFSTGDANSDNLGGRLELYWKTIKAFFKSPLWGNRKLGFDGHSTFLSVFADIGIFGGIFFVSMYVLARKKINSLFTEGQIRAYRPAFVGLILIGLTNPIHSAEPLAAAVWLFVPLMIAIFWEDKKYEKTLGN